MTFPSRIFCCIDMDAYYAQAESRRLGFSDSVPLAVQQWTNLIAVNYEARKFGISRFTNADEAKKLCSKYEFYFNFCAWIHLTFLKFFLIFVLNVKKGKLRVHFFFIQC